MIGYVGSIEKQTLSNNYFRQVLFTGKYAQLGLCPNSPVKTPSLDTSDVKHSTLSPVLSQAFGSAHQKPPVSTVLFQTRCLGAS